MVCPKPQYIFDKEKIKLPHHLQSLLPQNAHQMLLKVVDDASRAFRYLRTMEDYRDERYRTMCPRNSYTSYHMHADSVARLFSWSTDHKPNDPTLAPTPKLSPDILHFNVNQMSYDEYMRDYTVRLERFLCGPYHNWRISKKNLEKLVANSGLNQMEHQEFLGWWRSTFMAEMAKWEDRLAGLLLPSWEEVVDDVYKAILERVNIGTSTINEFHIGSMPVGSTA